LAQLDFTTSWSGQFLDADIDAVTSSMAIHHADDKQHLFHQVFAVLKPQGVFVLADHVAGTSACTQHLIDRERALVRLGGKDRTRPEQVLQVIDKDREVQREEGNLCESVAQYQSYLATSGFQDIDCLWRDYWLAVLVARKLADAASAG
jgi:tRNA (cmo5U34)-methyltransferase